MVDHIPAAIRANVVCASELGRVCVRCWRERLMIRILLVAAALVAAAGSRRARAARASSRRWSTAPRLTVQDMLNESPTAAIRATMLRRAARVMICPRVFRAGFIFGGRGRRLRAGRRGCRPAPGPLRPSTAWAAAASASRSASRTRRCIMMIMTDKGAARGAGQPVQARRRCLGRLRHPRRRRRGRDHRGAWAPTSSRSRRRAACSPACRSRAA